MEKEQCYPGLLHLRDALGEIALSPVDMRHKQELLAHIHRAFEDLPLRLRLVAQLRFIEDASYEDISRQLEISQANARKRVQEVRKWMIANLCRNVAMSDGT